MKARCSNPNATRYKDWGGRGITYCPEWEIFTQFLADMGPKPGPEYQLDRIDNDLGYFPDNVKWVTPLEQARNRERKV